MGFFLETSNRRATAGVIEVQCAGEEPAALSKGLIILSWYNGVPLPRRVYGIVVVGISNSAVEVPGEERSDDNCGDAHLREAQRESPIRTMTIQGSRRENQKMRALGADGGL